MHQLQACNHPIFSSTAFITTTISNLPSLRIHSTTCRITPTCRSKSPRSNKRKRPRTNPTPSSASTSSTSSTSTSSPSSSSAPPTSDNSTIPLELRLREELIHPLRKPRQTLFLTLSLSAFIGLLITISRFITQSDAPSTTLSNVVIDVCALSLFAYLSWRDIEFGRRSLNSLANIPELRDLVIIPFDKDRTQRLSTVLVKTDTVLVVGRSVDVVKYLERVQEEKEKLIVFATDLADRDGSQDTFQGVFAMAGGETSVVQDWRAWLGDAIPPRKYVGLFRIPKGDAGRGVPGEYVVVVGEPENIPLPGEAQRAQIVDV